MVSCLAQGSARRGASQGCDFLRLGFPQRQLGLVWGLSLEVNRLLPILTLQGSAGPPRVPRLELSKSGLMEPRGTCKQGGWGGGRLAQVEGLLGRRKVKLKK